MDINRRSQSDTNKQRFPERVLIADIAHPGCKEVQLQILPEGFEEGDLPIASYRRDVTVEK